MGPQSVMGTRELIEERQEQYGEFSDNAMLAQNLKNTVHCGPSWSWMPADQREALEMICSKISRLLGGNHAHKDTWEDIAGYATLISRTL